MANYMLYIYFAVIVFDGVTSIVKAIRLFIHRRDESNVTYPDWAWYFVLIRGILSLGIAVFFFTIYLQGLMVALPVLLIGTLVFGCEFIAILLIARKFSH